MAACATVPPADPYSAQADAGATLTAARAQLHATEQAILSQQAGATQQAAQTAGAAELELTRLAAESAGTQQAQALAFARDDATAQAQNVYTHLTQAAQDRTTQAARTESALQVTLDAQQVLRTRQANENERLEARAMFWNALSFIVWPLVIAIVLWLAVVTGREAWSWHSELNERRRSIIETRAGTLVLRRNPETNAVEAVLVQEAPRPIVFNTRRREPERYTEIGPADTLPLPRSLPTHTQTQPTGITVLARQLVQAAIQEAGEDATQLPGWRQLEWSSNTWQRAVSSLQQAGVIETRPRVGAYVSGGVQDLRDLEYRLPTLHLRPAFDGNRHR